MVFIVGIVSNIMNIDRDQIAVDGPFQDADNERALEHLGK